MRPSRRHMAVALAVALTCACAATVFGYVLFDQRWPDGAVPMNLQLGPTPALTDGSPTWDDSAIQALAAWNVNITRVQFQAIPGSGAPKGDGNRISNVFFDTEVYGKPFETRVLAVTTNWYIPPSRRIEADVVFNSNEQWDSYRGNLRPTVREFRRVALHEFGHALGLGHPDDAGQNVSAIMNGTVSNLERLTADDINGAQALYGAAGGGQFGNGTIAFPPRDQSLDFRSQLDAKYRDDLQRAPVATYVDVEGDIVWTGEYFRFRVNQCTHVQAIDRVFTEIDTGGTVGVCGASPTGTIAFPPRDQALDFRNQLEAKYRDGLMRDTTSTFVDNEGDVVWTQEYFRYRVNACDHPTAVQKVFAQIDGKGIQPVCR